VTYVDHFIVSVLDQLRDKKAIVFYAADHGESINEREHLHGTPRKMAPPEQFRVPMMVWMSDKYLESPITQFARLKQQAAMKVPRRHVELYDTIMGCLGYTSPDGGINEITTGATFLTLRRKVAEWRVSRRLSDFFIIRH
jgi:KDO II ethanolaminephosphotransferase